MSQLFLYCAVIGGTILVLQFVMLLVGAGADSDLDGADVGHDQSPFLKLFSLQTISAFLTFFGLVGLGTQSLDWSPLAVALTATAAGGCALFLVGKLMQALARLQSQGNVDLHNAVGHTGSVYLRVPAAGEGTGAVLMQVQGRTVECRAISRSREPIPTGSRVRIVERTDDDTLVVEPLA